MDYLKNPSDTNKFFIKTIHSLYEQNHVQAKLKKIMN